MTPYSVPLAVSPALMLRLRTKLGAAAGKLFAMPPARPSPAPHILVLWDVDHTLLETRGLGFTLYQRAFHAATGKPLDKLAQVSGRTELDIMRETLRINGIDPIEQSVTKLATALIEEYDKARDELATTGRALPGAAATLNRLAADSRIHQGVLTGNLRQVARIKLEVFKLHSRLDLEASAYGDDHHDRAALVTIAQTRATQRLEVPFQNRNTVLIGDTPNNIHAALTAGVHAIAIPTGKSDANALHTAGATTIVNDLTDPDRVLEIILDSSQ